MHTKLFRGQAREGEGKGRDTLSYPGFMLHPRLSNLQQLFLKRNHRISTSRNTSSLSYPDIVFYYMDESVLLGTKPLVDSIRHSIRTRVAYFPYDTLASVISPIDVTIRAISTLLNELGFFTGGPDVVFDSSADIKTTYENTLNIALNRTCIKDLNENVLHYVYLTLF